MQEEVKVHESVLEVARLIQNLRRENKWTQEKLAQEMGVSRHVVLRLEMGTNSRMDLVTVAKAIEACGERLRVSSQSMAPGSLKRKTEPTLEYATIKYFSEGNLRQAEASLDLIRRWHYPEHQIMPRCNREVAMALNYYFRGRTRYAVSHVNQVVMGLSMCGYPDSAKDIADRFNRHVIKGKAAIEEEIERMEVIVAEQGGR